MRCKLFTLLLSTLLLSTASLADVTYWRADKGKDYLQTADNIQPVMATNWYFYAEVEFGATNDATSVEITGGSIAGSLALTQEEDRWELYLDFVSKSALDAVFPSDAAYSMILSGGTLGSVTQQFNIAADAYPSTPYLTGADYSSCKALEVLEPLELNWNIPSEGADYVSLEIVEGSLLSEGDDVLDYYPGVIFTDLILSNDLFAVGSNYTGYLQFSSITNTLGGGGFGVAGVVGFNTETLFSIEGVNTAVGYDDFNDDSMDTSKWSIAFPPEEAVDTFSETNSRLGYTSLGTGDTFVAWFWEDSELSYTQNWSIAVTFTDTVSPASFSGDEEIYSGILVMADGDLDNNISAEFVNSASGREAASFVTSGGVEDVVKLFDSVSSTTLAVKISFDADTKMLYTAYSTGGDYTMQTNYSAAGWGMTDASVFNPAIFSGNFETVITSGQVYADNFRVYGETPISNEVSLIELEYNRDYEFPDTPLAGRANWYKLDFQTSHRVKTISVRAAGGDNVTIVDNEDTATGLEWYFETTEPITTPWDPANDGDWTITVGYINGSFQSTIVPFTQTNGDAIPVINTQPLFTSQGGLDGFVTNATELNVTFNSADASANFMNIDEFPYHEDGDIRFYATNTLQDVLGVVPTIDGLLSTTSDTIPVIQGTNWWLLSHGWGRSDYNEDGVGYIVVKQSESDFIFIITADADSDSMDDDWEIEFFGGTNMVDGGAYDDFDEDGMFNIEEFIAGVNPTNGSSVFAVEEPGPSPSGFVINWNSVEGRKYGIYWAKTLSDGFETIATDLLYPQSSYTDTVHTNAGCGFYYIDVQLQD
jgi:hypothetical protein